MQIYKHISKDGELGMILFENIWGDSYKSAGVLNIWQLKYKFLNDQIPNEPSFGYDKFISFGNSIGENNFFR